MFYKTFPTIILVLSFIFKPISASSELPFDANFCSNAQKVTKAINEIKATLECSSSTQSMCTNFISGNIGGSLAGSAALFAGYAERYPEIFDCLVPASITKNLKYNYDFLNVFYFIQEADAKAPSNPVNPVDQCASAQAEMLRALEAKRAALLQQGGGSSTFDTTAAKTAMEEAFRTEIKRDPIFLRQLEQVSFLNGLTDLRTAVDNGTFAKTFPPDSMEKKDFIKFLNESITMIENTDAITAISNEIDAIDKQIRDLNTSGTGDSLKKLTEIKTQLSERKRSLQLTFSKIYDEIERHINLGANLEVNPNDFVKGIYNNLTARFHLNNLPRDLDIIPFFQHELDRVITALNNTKIGEGGITALEGIINSARMPEVVKAALRNNLNAQISTRTDLAAIGSVMAKVKALKPGATSAALRKALASLPVSMLKGLPKLAAFAGGPFAMTLQMALQPSEAIACDETPSNSVTTSEGCNLGDLGGNELLFFMTFPLEDQLTKVNGNITTCKMVYKHFTGLAPSQNWKLSCKDNNATLTGKGNQQNNFIMINVDHPNDVRSLVVYAHGFCAKDFIYSNNSNSSEVQFQSAQVHGYTLRKGAAAPNTCDDPRLKVTQSSIDQTQIDRSAPMTGRIKQISLVKDATTKFTTLYSLAYNCCSGATNSICADLKSNIEATPVMPQTSE
ncbi:MAG: hypothetical protein K1X29_08920 [Bdellovibrionales bacterium]|nr:hypothetical protein [Bdellovibrionales bacterium]